MSVDQGGPLSSMRRMSVGVLTVSDTAHRGVRVDESGPAIAELLEIVGAQVQDRRVVPDETDLIERTIIHMVDTLDLDVVLTTGGTGLAPRDVTPEATHRVIEREVPGIAEAIRIYSLKKTARAMLSRGIAGVRGRTLIINLPGSPKGVRESLHAIVDQLPHAVALLRERPVDH